MFVIVVVAADFKAIINFVNHVYVWSSLHMDAIMFFHLLSFQIIDWNYFGERDMERHWQK